MHTKSNDLAVVTAIYKRPPILWSFEEVLARVQNYPGAWRLDEAGRIRTVLDRPHVYWNQPLCPLEAVCQHYDGVLLCSSNVGKYVSAETCSRLIRAADGFIEEDGLSKDRLALLAATRLAAPVEKGSGRVPHADHF